MPSFDLIGAIELAYDRTSTEHAWLEAITHAVAPSFAGKAGTLSSFVFDLTEEHLVIGTSAGGRDRKDHERHNQTGREQVGRVRPAYECDSYTLLSRVFGAAVAKAGMAAAGIEGDDSVGLRANATPTSGIMLTYYVRTGHRLRHRPLWTRFAAHLGAAFRLRRSAAIPSPEHAPAVLLPNGRLEKGNGDTIAARASLTSAAKAIDRARGKLRRLDPEAASALWRTMVEGEWSLVDWYDHDGKRFLIAQENRIPHGAAEGVGDLRERLSPREEQVVACAAMGHSNKLIAYDLGLSTGTMAVFLGRAARKLGVSGPVALVRAYRESYVR